MNKTNEGQIAGEIWGITGFFNLKGRHLRGEQKKGRRGKGKIGLNLLAPELFFNFSTLCI